MDETVQNQPPQSYDQLMMEAELLAQDTARLDGFDFDKMSPESRRVYVATARREVLSRCAPEPRIKMVPYEGPDDW